MMYCTTTTVGSTHALIDPFDRHLNRAGVLIEDFSNFEPFWNRRIVPLVFETAKRACRYCTIYNYCHGVDDDE
jgi:hypothetical protein